MSLPDLHRHLDGSIRPATLAELSGRPVPEDLPFFPGMGLDAALSRFACTLAALRSVAAVERVASEICEDALADGVTTLEIRFAPQLHGPGIADVVDAALAGIAGRAGLVLCGLYGEAPDLLLHLVELAASRRGVVGLDLAGGPAPDHAWGLLDYAPAFARARAIGLGRTVHAGEGRPPGEVRDAVHRLHATRIGHGTTLLDDPDLPALLVERGVTIEACPTSNWHVGAIGSVDAHPLPRWLDLGVRVCVNTDNTLLSGVTASDEHERVGAMPGMSAEKLAAVVRFGHDAAFSR